MNIEQYSEHIVEKIDACSEHLQKALQNVCDSGDYGRAIASLTCQLMANDIDSDLWLQRFGLTNCAFVFPSDLFITPVRALFPVECNSQRFNSRWPAGLDSEWSNSFFSPRLWLEKGLLQVHFVQDDVFAMQ